MKHINPQEVFKEKLLSIQNPATYTGGEFGAITKDDNDVDLTFAIAFPDLYQIGMSNQAIKIIYQGLNAKNRVRCERVFAPNLDFEKLLHDTKVPLYTLETGIPLNEVDIIGFSIGYELGLTNVLTMLSCGKIPLLKKDRTSNDPIIIAGGCGVTNPLPISSFFDAVFIGEAENELFDLIEKLAHKKKNGATRDELLDFLTQHPSVWISGKKTKKAFFTNFGKEATANAWYPLPAIKPVQDHGVVEIMRGCPNGCRFCHAGIYYRPQRMKSIPDIIKEIDTLVFDVGYREISLTSLSSADYEGIGELLDILNDRYKNMHVSFQLPSLKVNSFSLPILEKLSAVRKSGLTFAVETPVEAWQLSLNKEVYEEKLVDIIKDAKKRGWNKAKFYFMIGLPVETDDMHEEIEIVKFLLKIQEETKIQCTVNVGSFIPKPHTPYQYVPQITIEEANRKMQYIKDNLPRGKFKVSTHDPFVSFIEGMISRGDERVGEIILEAFNKGCRLDAWEDQFKKDIWINIIENSSWDIKTEVCRERSLDEKLPWAEISLGPSEIFYKNEFKKSQEQKLTNICSESCKNPCGICNNFSNNVQENIQKSKISVLKFRHNSNIALPNRPFHFLQESFSEINIPKLWRVIFAFEKQNGAELLPHLSTMEIFNKALFRSNLPVIFTTGFNPLPRLEFAASLSLGIKSKGEIGSFLLREDTSIETVISSVNNHLSNGLKIVDMMIFPITRKIKRESLASLLWGADYTYNFKNKEYSQKFTEFLDSTLFKEANIDCEVFSDNENSFSIKLQFKDDRKFRNLLEEYFSLPIYEISSITREEMYGIYKDEINTYFKIYERIAKKNLTVINNEDKTKKNIELN